MLCCFSSPSRVLILAGPPHNHVHATSKYMRIVHKVSKISKVYHIMWMLELFREHNINSTGILGSENIWLPLVWHTVHLYEYVSNHMAMTPLNIKLVAAS